MPCKAFEKRMFGCVNLMGLSSSLSADAVAVWATRHRRLLPTGAAPVLQPPTTAACRPLSAPLHAAAGSSTTGEHFGYVKGPGDPQNFEFVILTANFHLAGTKNFSTIF